MINVKEQIYKQLITVTDNVNDIYPREIKKFPFIMYIEEENKVSEYTDMREQMSYVRYRIDIWNENESTSDLAIKIDEAISGLGLKRTQCLDSPEQSGYRHKIMRYEMIINVDDQSVFHK